MLDWILEQQDVWQRLQSCRKPVVLYGMGDGAVKILRVMEQYGIRPAALFASDDFARGNLFMGYRVEKLRDIQARYDDFIIVMAFAVRDLPTVQRIRSLSQQIELVAPDVPVAGINLFTLDFVRQYEQEFARVESMLADEQSKKVLHNIVNFKLSGKLDTSLTARRRWRRPIRTSYGPQTTNILPTLAPTAATPSPSCCILRAAASGCSPLSRTKRPTKSSALPSSRWALPGGLPVCRWQPIPSSRRWNLTAGAADSPPCGRSRWSPALRARQSRRSSWCRASRWTMWRGEETVTLINMDVEGAERQALEGCAKIIARDRPKMLIAAYHRSEDLFAIPLQIAAMRSDYRFYLRHYPYIPAWDTNLYCV